MRKMKTRISLSKSEVNDLDQALLLAISHVELFAKTCGTDITDEWYFKYLENFKRETDQWLAEYSVRKGPMKKYEGMKGILS